MMARDTVLVLGATGYIGSQLTARLLEQGLTVRAAGRSLRKLKQLAWADHPRVQLAAVDVLDDASLGQACQDVGAAYYLVHSMNAQQKDFEQADRRAARNMVKVSQAQGLERIIFLGGLGDDEKNLSRHLRSRHEVSRILHSGAVPATTLRAAMIIGHGSISFEILRALVDRLPIMITPRWVNTESQPIAVSNVLQYLVGCLGAAETAGQVFDIGGEDVVTYRKLMDIYAEEAGLPRRFIFPVPLLTTRLSAYWIGLVTPYPSYIARPLAEGLRNRVVCQDQRIRQIIPQKLLTSREAIRAALKAR